MNKAISPFSITNIRCFIAFRLFFNSRFYYPVFTILFLDYGLTIEQFAILNSVWAATIVIAEVPSGALADIIGRKRLLMTTSILMVLEMMLLISVPLENKTLVFWAFLFNRVLSGLAEAMASGADEALAYDSLIEQDIAPHWPHVLSVMMRIKSLGMMLAMSLGAIIYDPEMVNRFLVQIGSSTTVTQDISMRFPIYLTLVLALLSCFSVLMMKETNGLQHQDNKEMSAAHFDIRGAFNLTLQAGIWIIKTPFALVVILFAMAYDHVLRMLITLSSQYFRLIHLPEASFGLIGSAMALVGLLLPKLAEKMVLHFTPTQNMLWLATIALTAISGIALFIPYYGLLPVFLVSAGIMMTSFFTSHYLNRITDSHRRATILSFKGLALNLAYGLIGIAYATLIRSLRHNASHNDSTLPLKAIENQAFQEAMFWFTPYTLAIIAVILFYAKPTLKNTSLHRLKG